MAIGFAITLGVQRELRPPTLQVAKAESGIKVAGVEPDTLLGLMLPKSNFDIFLSIKRFVDTFQTISNL